MTPLRLLLRACAMSAVCTALIGCASLSRVEGSSWNVWSHSLQQARGHLQLIASARHVQDVLDDPQTDPTLRQRLRLSQAIRDFAVTELQLPDGASYRRFARLDRTAVVWNVVAAPEFSLSLKPWCLPVAGCVGYLGFFDQAQAQAMAATLREQGWEVSVYPVVAYSTLGLTDWLGGDPLLDTFIHWPEASLARLIFHEMAHQVVYAPGDTSFNESFATAVERLGWARWQQRRGMPAMPEDTRAQQWVDLIRLARDDLTHLYASSLELSVKRQQKRARLDRLREDYQQLRQSWNGPAPGYDAWMSSVNNASLGAQGIYHDAVDSFVRIFERCERHFPCFYARVRDLAALPAAQRQQMLHDTGSRQ